MPGTTAPSQCSLARVALAAAVGALLGVGLAAPVNAQDEQALKAAFEGRQVTVKIDMPGTSDGVDLEIDSARPLDAQQYEGRLKDYGTAIRAGESAPVTLVKVKKDLIEFHLGGGGYGTFGDDTSTSVSMRLVEKSDHEKDLERMVRDEHDSRRRDDLQRELDDLRARREAENRRIEAARAEAEEQKRVLLAQRRLSGGSRFNLRYKDKVPPSITAEQVMAALANFVAFSTAVSEVPLPTMAQPAAAPGADLSRPAAPAAAQSGPPAGGLLPRKGMTRAEAERAYGPPTQTSQRQEGGLTVTTLVFAWSGQRITADFVEDVLVRYTLTSQ